MALPIQLWTYGTMVFGGKGKDVVCFLVLMVHAKMYESINRVICGKGI